jgi:hypothetical protein
MPECFQQAFGKSVAVIIDCFEVFSQRPSSLLPRAQVWSNYKHHSTGKFLIGITPQGTVCFISRCWGGRTSDQYITENSGFCDLLIPGDAILADRGFNIGRSVGLLHVKVLIPAFKGVGRNQVSSEEIEMTREIAHVRIHVERVIGLVRRKFLVLSSVLNHSWFHKPKGYNWARIDYAAIICCALTNLCPSIVPMSEKNDEFPLY